MGTDEKQRLIEILCGSTMAKGPRAITLTKVKGHATQEMVDEGRVGEEQKKVMMEQTKEPIKEPRMSSKA